MPESLKRKIKTYASSEGGKRARISNSDKSSAKSSKKSHQPTTVTLPTKIETSVVKIEAEMPPRRSEPQAKPVNGSLLLHSKLVFFPSLTDTLNFCRKCQSLIRRAAPKQSLKFNELFSNTTRFSNCYSFETKIDELFQSFWKAKRVTAA